MEERMVMVACSWCAEPISAPRSRHDRCYDEVKAKALALARDLSALLKKGGLPRGGRYAPFGYTAAGVKTGDGSSNGTRDVEAHVYVVGDYGNRPQPGLLAKAAALIAADGRFEIVDAAELSKGNSFHVSRKTATA